MLRDVYARKVPDDLSMQSLHIHNFLVSYPICPFSQPIFCFLWQSKPFHAWVWALHVWKGPFCRGLGDAPGLNTLLDHECMFPLIEILAIQRGSNILHTCFIMKVCTHSIMLSSILGWFGWVGNLHDCRCICVLQTSTCPLWIPFAKITW